MPAPPLYDVITCRGVFNDLIIDADREAALQAMARALRPGGFLFCDVREAGASAARADGTPVSKTVTTPDGGELTFTSTSSWSAGLLLVHEEHVLIYEKAEQRSEYQFAMRPWAKEEITDRFARVGLIQMTSEPGVGRSTPDRLFIHARRG
jgi:Methyltransferase domain